jgi:hypothetical protein
MGIVWQSATRSDRPSDVISNQTYSEMLKMDSEKVTNYRTSSARFLQNIMLFCIKLKKVMTYGNGSVNTINTDEGEGLIYED